MDQLQPPTTSYRRLHLATVWICIVSIIATLAATAIEQFYFKTGASLIIGGCGLVAAIPFAVVWSLSFLGRHRLCPATVALLAAIAGCCLALLLFGSWCHELAEVISTGTSSYRRPGDRFNSRGIEFLLVAVYEWVIGVPAFLLLYGLGWLISRVPKKGEKGVGSGSGVVSDERDRL